LVELRVAAAREPTGEPGLTDPGLALRRRRGPGPRRASDGRVTRGCVLTCTAQHEISARPTTVTPWVLTMRRVGRDHERKEKQRQARTSRRDPIELLLNPAGFGLASNGMARWTNHCSSCCWTLCYLLPAGAIPGTPGSIFKRLRQLRSVRALAPYSFVRALPWRFPMVTPDSSAPGVA
jgi:hypothetical protein